MSLCRKDPRDLPLRANKSPRRGFEKVIEPLELELIAIYTKLTEEVMLEQVYKFRKLFACNVEIIELSPEGWLDWESNIKSKEAYAVDCKLGLSTPVAYLSSNKALKSNQIRLYAQQPEKQST